MLTGGLSCRRCLAFFPVILYTTSCLIHLSTGCPLLRMGEYYITFLPLINLYSLLKRERNKRTDTLALEYSNNVGIENKISKGTLQTGKITDRNLLQDKLKPKGLLSPMFTLYHHSLYFLNSASVKYPSFFILLYSRPINTSPIVTDIKLQQGVDSDILANA